MSKEDTLSKIKKAAGARTFRSFSEAMAAVQKQLGQHHKRTTSKLAERPVR